LVDVPYTPRDHQVFQVPDIPCKISGKSMVIKDLGGNPMIHYFNKAIPKKLCTDLFESIEKLQTTLKP